MGRFVGPKRVWSGGGQSRGAQDALPVVGDARDDTGELGVVVRVGAGDAFLGSRERAARERQGDGGVAKGGHSLPL